MDQKAKNGGTPKKAPIGYRNVATVTPSGAIARTVEIDELRAPLITWAYEAYATGASLRQLTDELTSRGFTTVPTPRYATKPIRTTSLQ